MPEDQPVTNHPSRWPIAIAAIFISLVVLGGYVFKTCSDKPSQVAQTVANALQSQVTINTVIQTSLEKLRDESKLVVFTANVAVMITKFSEKKTLYGNCLLYTSPSPRDS